MTLAAAIESTAELIEVVAGRTIVRAERTEDSGQTWGHSENSVTLWLDDGAVISFEGYGYDASGLITTIERDPVPA